MAADKKLLVRILKFAKEQGCIDVLDDVDRLAAGDCCEVADHLIGSLFGGRRTDGESFEEVFRKRFSFPCETITGIFREECIDSACRR